MNISVVIPVFNGKDTLIPLLERLNTVLPGIADEFEILLVNDGSPDTSWKIVEELAAKFPWVVGIDLLRNFGQHNATLCGIRMAKYDVTVTLDDDLQHPPEEIPVLLKKLNKGYDVIYGVPKKMPHSTWRNLFSVLTKRLLSYTMGIKTLESFSAFRIFHTNIRKAFEKYDGPDVIVDVLLSWGTRRFSTQVVNESRRTQGQSNYNFASLVKYTLLVMTSFSTGPLRLASIVGFSFTLVGFMATIYVVVIYFIYGSVPGFPFLASIILLFSGAQLFALGILGEYLAHIFERTSGKQAYIISKISPPGTME